MANDSWVKLHTSLLLSQKYRSLPTDTHRMIFYHQLMFQAKGIVSDTALCSALCSMSEKAYLRRRDDLISCGLLNPDGTVVDFEKKQVNPSTARVRRWRERHSDVSCNVTGNGDAEADAEAEEEAEKNIYNISRVCGKVIGHLNAKAGTKFSPKTKATVRLIKARMAEGRTLEDFLAVIDNRTAAWKSDPKMVQYLRPETLFNATKMESYLGAATAPAAKEPRPYDVQQEDDPDLTEAERQKALAALKAATGGIGAWE